jgi:hypothetical protein
MGRQRKRTGQPATPGKGPGWWRRLPATAQVALTWAAGILAAALATVLAGLLTGTLQSLFADEEDGTAKKRLPFTTVVEVNDNHCEVPWWVPHAPSDIAFEPAIVESPPGWTAYDVAGDGASTSPTLP